MTRSAPTRPTDDHRSSRPQAPRNTAVAIDGGKHLEVKSPAGLAQRVRFFSQFVTHPGMVGAIAPSSGVLARRMIRDLDLRHAAAVLEYGPGTGAFTGHIRAAVGASTKFVAIEFNPSLAEALRRRFPTLRVHQRSVEDAPAICREEGIDAVDAIVSGLPWAAFPEDLQRRLLEATVKVLRPGGRMVTFGYHVGRFTSAGKRFYRILPEYFPGFQISGPIWRNIPPAFVVTCVKR
ncbi:MAG: methyltransferase domain-containing protein [Planctomycetota bacterium]|nr:methyltransferase domain-containing protein [Planctomycetota bacterium]